MEEIQVFNYSGNQVRTTVRNEEPWFVAADVCKVLDIKNSRDAMERLDPDEKDVAITDTLGGGQKMTIVNEPGLYSLILTSRKPEAKVFKRWVTHEVIPSIRKNGGYMRGQEEMSDDDLLARALVVAQNVLKEREKRLAALEPKAEYCTKVLNSGELLTVTTIAKDYGMSAVNFNKLLERLGVQYHQGDMWHLYQEYADKGYTDYETYLFGDEGSRTAMKWTQNGRKFLYDLLIGEGIYPLEYCQ